MARYQVWDKQSQVVTPIGEVLTAEQWAERYPWAMLPAAVPVISGGFYNGGYIGELSQMVEIYTEQGADFTGAVTSEQKLAIIEAFENAQAAAAQNTASVEERTAAALEFLAMSQLPDAE